MSTGPILQPWAFWTTTIYMITCGLVYFRFQKENPRHLREWVVAIMSVSIGSFLAHARFDIFSLAFDQASIVILLWSFHIEFKNWARAIGAASLVIALLILIFVSLPYDLWVAVVFLNFLGSIYYMIKRLKRNFLFERMVILTLTLYGFSFLMYVSDKHPLLCGTAWAPFGHPVWHLGSGISALIFGFWWFQRPKDHPW